MPTEEQVLVLVLNWHRATRSTSSAELARSQPEVVMLPMAAMALTAVMPVGRMMHIHMLATVATAAMVAAVLVLASAHV